MVRARFGLLLWVGVLAAGCLSARANERPTEGKKPSGPEPALVKEMLEFNRPGRESRRNARLLAFVKDRKRAKQGIALAVKMQKEAKGEKPFNVTGSILLGRAAQIVKEPVASRYFFEHAVERAVKLQNAENILQAFDGLIGLHWELKQYQAVIAACVRLADLKGPREIELAKPFYLERLVQAKAKLGQTDDALRMAEELERLDEGGFYFTQLKGWVLREAGRYPDAIKAYRQTLDKLAATRRLPADQRERMQDQIRHILTGVYVENKDIESAVRLYQELIKRQPENPVYKNGLGFIWADAGLKLEESEKLIREALDLDRRRQEKRKKEGTLDAVKENPAYLDSLGWVLFRQKKFKEALTELKKAAADEGEGAHLEIWDHLGDVHMALGQKKDATDTWQKALTMEDLSKRDAERRKRVIAKLKAAGVEPKLKVETEDF